MLPNASSMRPLHPLPPPGQSGTLCALLGLPPCRPRTARPRRASMIAASTNPVPLLPSPPQSRSLPSPRYPVFAASTSIVVAAAALAAADRTVVIKRPARHRLTLTVSTVACGIWVGGMQRPHGLRGTGT